ncbi:MAG: GNAT family N-acetyltransferase [Hyphomonadaceae bacterium]|nr:GNAT family N-acetyltransferase [Hyphomonadaceae bacterium]
MDDADVDAMAALHGEAFPRGWTAAEIAALRARGAFGYVAADAAPVGFALAWAPGGDAEVLTLVTAPARRRSGVGAGLMALILAHAARLGAPAVTLEVAADNAAARALYARLGFLEVARRPRYYARAHGAADALVLRRGTADLAPVGPPGVR